MVQFRPVKSSLVLTLLTVVANSAGAQTSRPDTRKAQASEPQTVTEASDYASASLNASVGISVECRLLYVVRPMRHRGRQPPYDPDGKVRTRQHVIADLSMPSATAASSIVNPAKKRSSTSSASSASTSASLVSTASRSSNWSSIGSVTGSHSSNSWRWEFPPRRRLRFRLAESMRIRLIASAAAAKKCPRLSHVPVASLPTSRKYAS